MNLARIKAACVNVRAPAAEGTAYLVAPTKLATCYHVVESAGENGAVELLLPNGVRTARVAKMDAGTDCAILDLEAPLPGREPLPIAGRSEGHAQWDGYGFPALAAGSGLPFFGMVVDPEAQDDLKRPMVTLYSEMLAAGMAAPVHGLSGGPVVINGAVIGHFSRLLGTPGAPGQPALGVVYAVRASSILALLGTEPDVPSVHAPPATELADLIPRIAPDEFHAFISYRSSDRPFAIGLYERLTAVGFRVYLDQRELVPGDQLAQHLHAALAKSFCGITLVSHGWIESPWCADEGNAMVARAVNEQGRFRVIPARIEDVPMPAMFAGRLWLDFVGESAPSGRKLDQLIYGILGRPAPTEGRLGETVKRDLTIEEKVQITLTDATDEALRRVEDVSRDPTRFRSFLDFIRRAGLPEVALRLRAATALIDAGRNDVALDILPALDQSPRSQQLRALALSRNGRDDEALQILAPLFERDEIDAETGGILAGIYKRLWRRTGYNGYLIKSFETYRATYAATGDPYNGINVAAMALLLDKNEESRRAAARIRDELGARAENQLKPWDRATLAEAFLLLDDVARAADWYERELGLNLARPANIAVMRRQARLLLAKKGLDRTALDKSLPVPRVVGFSGHMTDAPDRAIARFPETKVESVRRAIREWLRGHGGRCHAVSSAARGADLLFLHEVLANQGTATVLLPFPEVDFMKESVGQGWDGRFDAVLRNDRVEVRTLLEKTPSKEGLEQAFEMCNLAIVDEAERLAALLDDADPVLLTVWNGNPGDASGGTAHAVRVWQQRAHEVVNIDVSKM